MNHTDHVNLIRPADRLPGGTWADLGAGTGAFTLALRELLGAQAQIYAVDRERASLHELERTYGRRFGNTDGLHLLAADLREQLELPLLDGVLMANSLHFFKDKAALLRQVREYLKPGGQLLLVEYNVDKGNPWVPYPLSFETFKDAGAKAGFREPRLLARHPSSFLREFYSATAKAG